MGRGVGWMGMLLLAALVLAACGGNTPAASQGQGEPIPTPVQLTLEEAEAVAGTFLDAWLERDYASMYRLISFRSREAYPEEVFRAAYENAATAMTLSRIEFEFKGTLRQGNTVAISYDVTFRTGLMGDFVDAGRIMRLVADSEGWRVAWSSTDIFSELAGGATLNLERIIPTRANIYDRNGQILVNQSGVAIPVIVVQENIPDLEACNETLTRVLRLSYDQLQAIYDSRAPNWNTIVGEIDAPTYEAESEALIENCDATFDERPTRRYVSGGLAPHVIGYVGYATTELLPELAVRGIPQDAIVGIAGVERAWDETLTGRPGGRLQIVSPGGDVLRTLAEVAPGRSESVYLTLDAGLQLIVQQALSDAYNVGNWAPYSQGAAVVVMDIHSGEVLAMASYPSFDPNLFNPDNAREDAESRLIELVNDPRNPQLNRTTQGAYPAGSTFKIVTMIAAADSGTYELNHRYVCSGLWSGDIVRLDWLPGGHGSLDLPGALTQSCDPYFYQTGADLDAADPNLLPNYAVRLGFGAPTGIADLAEAAGLVPNPEWVRRTYGLTWTFSDAVNMAVGQGYLQVTPLQMVRLVSAVANGGTLYVPQVVHHVQIIGEEPSYVFEPEVEREFGVRPEVLEAVRAAMCDVTVRPEGTAEYVFGPTSALGESPVRVCGKTGTAQTGGENVPPHAWFVAFAPAEDPQIAIAVIIETSREGSEIAAPVVRRILENYYSEDRSPYAPEWWPPPWWEGEYVPLTTPGA